MSSIDHVEVLLDGAAAQYGTDAIAGVVNIIQKKNGSGGSINLNGGKYFDGGGTTADFMANVGLTPDTPYTRARFRTLYGSTERAAVPAAVVRARTVADANADYRTYVRDTRCENGRFRFDGLPDGGWFLIVPVTSGDAPLVLIQAVQTRGGRVVSITL